VKFTPSGGKIFLNARLLPDGSKYVSVCDTGPGIPEDEIPKVLQAFGQGSLAHKTAEGGTGLGLPIVRSLVELHGGKFHLKSELRKGTEVSFVLPRQRVMQPAQPLPERHTTGDTPARVELGRRTRRPRLVSAA
jgi:two-component system cell cycle sensor histidine kinase PleC